MGEAMDEKEFSAHLERVMHLADSLHRSNNDTCLLIWLSDEVARNDLTGWQRKQIYNAATSYLRP